MTVPESSSNTVPKKRRNKLNTYKTEVCDSCSLIAYDEGFDGDIMIELGEMIEDHLCDATEEPGIICACGCRTIGQI